MTNVIHLKGEYVDGTDTEKAYENAMEGLHCYEHQEAAIRAHVAAKDARIAALENELGSVGRDYHRLRDRMDRIKSCRPVWVDPSVHKSELNRNLTYYRMYADSKGSPTDEAYEAFYLIPVEAIDGKE